MKTFYRYIRPVKLNEQRLELETVPHGGVCLRFDEILSGGLLFTHARCHGDELFSKAVAKRVADQRADQRANVAGPMRPTVPMSMDPGTLVTSVITACETWDPVLTDLGPNFFVTYLKLELHELRNALVQLTDSNRREQAKAEIWKAGLAAARHGERYESLSR